MKNKIAVVAAFLVSFAAAFAVAAPPTATGVWLAPDVNYQFVNCAAVGSSMQIIPNGKYMVRVMQEETNLVYGTSFDGGALNNRPMPANIAFLESFFADDGGTLLACQSALGTGDVYLTGTH
jgi:hypothetical protein